MWLGPLVVLFFLVCCGSIEAGGHHDDVFTVESLRRDVREPAPLKFATEAEDLVGVGNSPEKQQARSNKKKGMKNSSGKSDEGGYYKTYGSDAEGEKGYLKATYSKGNHGYKTLDTFHKQDGDKYAFEKHVAYGKARADKKSSHNDHASSHSGKAGDHEGAGTMVDTHYAGEGDHHEGGDEHAEGSDHGSYTHESGGHYTDHGPESSSYGHSEGYANGDGEHSSYESHSSYSKSSGGEHGDGGEHYY